MNDEQVQQLVSTTLKRSYPPLDDIPVPPTEPIVGRRHSAGRVGIAAVCSVIVAVCLSLVYLAQTSPTRVASPPSPTSSSSPAAGSTSPSLSERGAPGQDLALEASLDTLGRETYASTYGGLILDDGEYTVFLTVLDPDVERHFERLAAPASIRFRATPNSLQTLHAAYSKLLSDEDDLGKQGIDIVSSGVDPSTGRLDVGVMGLTDDHRRVLETTYGKGLVHVYEDEPGHLGCAGRCRPTP